MIEYPDGRVEYSFEEDVKIDSVARELLIQTVPGVSSVIYIPGISEMSQVALDEAWRRMQQMRKEMVDGRAIHRLFKDLDEIHPEGI